MKKILVIRISILIFIILNLNKSVSQSPEWLVFNTSNSILQSNHVNDIEIDNEGNIWIATNTRDLWNTGGIIYTDRIDWKIYNSKNCDIQSDKLRKFEIDKQGFLWLATINKGVIEFKDKTINNYDTLNSPLPWQSTIEIAVDSMNIKWFANATTGGGLISYDDKNWRVFDSNDVAFPSKGYVSSVFVDKNNDKWIGYFWNEHIYKYNDKTWTIYDTLALWERNNRISSFARDSSGNLWIGWDYPVKFTGTKWMIYFVSPRSSISTIAVDKNNDIWFGSYVANDGGIMKYNNSEWTVFDPTNSPMPNNVVEKIVIDKYGNKWIACWGLVVYKEGGVVGITDVEDDKKIEQNKILCYPNPSTGAINLRYRIETTGIINIFLTDILGNKTLLKTEYKFPGDYVETFNLNVYPQGIYNIVLHSGNTIYNDRIILIR